MRYDIPTILTTIYLRDDDAIFRVMRYMIGYIIILRQIMTPLTPSLSGFPQRQNVTLSTSPPSLTLLSHLAIVVAYHASTRSAPPHPAPNPPHENLTPPVEPLPFVSPSSSTTPNPKGILGGCDETLSFLGRVTLAFTNPLDPSLLGVSWVLLEFEFEC